MPTDTDLVPFESADAPQRAVAGLAAVAALDDDAFERNLAMLRKGQERTRRIQESLMTPGVDYGVVPGTKRPTLMKAGAEKLSLAYGLVARITTDLVTGDGYTAPTLRYDATCTMHVGSWDGPIVAVGYGTASSWERKYRYRSLQPTCPDCGKEGLIKTRRNQWWHPADAKPVGGCGANFTLDDPRITSGEQVENQDPYDVANTLLKMSAKRSHVDSILRATGTSGLFTQDFGEDASAIATKTADWTFSGFMARVEHEFHRDHIAATAKAMYPEAASIGRLTNEQRRLLYEDLLEEAMAAGDASDDADVVEEAGDPGYGS